MPTIDLTTPRRRSRSVLDALPRRIGLNRRELELVSAEAGDAPLPYLPQATGGPPGGGDTLADRLGARPRVDAADRVRALVEALPDPRESLARRGLLTAAGVDAGLRGAVGLLATPRFALDLSVRVGARQVAAWHRHDQAAVATLATTDGVVFELAWFPVDQWPAELGRVAVLPQDHPAERSALPDVVDLPQVLLNAAVEAVTGHRGDLLAVLAAEHGGEVLDGRGRAVPDGVVTGLLGALARETRGRLRAVAAEIPEPGSDAEVSTVGVLAWLLLAEGWHVLRPHVLDGQHRVEVRRVAPGDLATELSPLLAGVLR